jgi:hypothetical protein
MEHVLFTRICEEGDEFFIYACSHDQKTVKSFTHGRILFNPDAGTVQFGGLQPVGFPAFSQHVKPGRELKFRLIGPEGDARQTRSIGIRETGNGVLYSPGAARTPARRSRDSGWVNRNYRFRAFLTHPGVTSNLSSHSAQGREELPLWMKQSIERQRRFWNRLVELCDQAREHCARIDGEAVRAFVGEAVRPALRGFNEVRRVSRESISIPQSLEGARPSVFALWRFGNYLRRLEKLGKPVPAGLADVIIAFARSSPPDFAPITRFERGFHAIVARERVLADRISGGDDADKGQKQLRPVSQSPHYPAEILTRRDELELRNWEWRPVATAFQAALKRRLSTKASFFEGWPKYRPTGRPDWAIHYFLNGAPGRPALLQSRGIRGLRFDPPLTPMATGHPGLAPGSRKSERKLCRAEIGFRDALSGEKRSFSFAVLIHRDLPVDAEIKQWRLVSNREGLWLCFIVQVRVSVSESQGRIGAVHIGWSKNKDEVTVASIYAPGDSDKGEFQDIVVDLADSPSPNDVGLPFRIRMGGSRWGRRSSYWVSELIGLRVQPSSSGAVRVEDTWAGIDRVMRWRDTQLNHWRKQIRSCVPDAPAALDTASADALFRFANLQSNVLADSAVREWEQAHLEATRILAELFRRVSRRLENGYWRTAHDICQFFQSRHIIRIAIQGPILASLARQIPGHYESIAMSHARVYRHRMALGKLLLSLETVAASYGMQILKVKSYNITRRHYECGYINDLQGGAIIHCGGCGQDYPRERNALRNMVAAARMEGQGPAKSIRARTSPAVPDGQGNI